MTDLLIPVAESLPSDDTLVLAYSPEFGWKTLTYLRKWTRWFCNNGYDGYFVDDVTHWTHLPPVPGKEAK